MRNVRLRAASIDVTRQRPKDAFVAAWSAVTIFGRWTMTAALMLTLTPRNVVGEASTRRGCPSPAHIAIYR